MITALLIIAFLLMLIVSAALIHWIWTEDEEPPMEHRVWETWN